jgi:hypothetical protein
VDLLSVERFPVDELLSRIRETRLVGFDGAQPYRHASVELLRSVDTSDLSPAQNYVLMPGVRTILALWEALAEHGVDIFDLDGGVFVTTTLDPGERIPVIPPVVEESLEPDGRTVLLINDGMHRVFAARSLGLPISVVLVRGVPAEYPYYAFPRHTGWEGIETFETLPAVFEKKAYRQPTGYRALFRDFNAQFPGVQAVRPASNPAHITM